MSEAKEYLMRIRWYDVQIDGKTEEYEKMKSMVYRITPILSDAGGTGSGNTDRIGHMRDKLIDMRDDLNREIDEFVEYKAEARRLMRKMGNPDYFRVLHMRYFQNKSIREMASAMKYSYDGMKRFHSAALQAFEKVLEEEKKAIGKS